MHILAFARSKRFSRDRRRQDLRWCRGTYRHSCRARAARRCRVAAGGAFEERTGLTAQRVVYATQASPAEAPSKHTSVTSGETRFLESRKGEPFAMSEDGRTASVSASEDVMSPGSIGSAEGSFRRQRSYVSETGGGIDWRPKKYRAPKKIKPPKPFGQDVKKQNLWVRNVTAPVVDRVRKFSIAPMVTLDNVEAIALHESVPKLDSPRSIKACLEMGVDPTGYDLMVVDIEDFRDDRLDEQIWRLRYEHALQKRENLLQSLQGMRHSFSDREALNEFRPAKGKMAHVESTVVAANESMSIQISSHRNERFHEKTRHWERTHQTNLAKEHAKQKQNEFKHGESEAYIQAKLDAKAERVKKVDRDNYAKSRAEYRRLEFEKAENARIAKQERLRIDAFAAEKRRLDRIAEREMRESVAEKIRQKEAYDAQTRGILDWQQAKVDEKRRAMEADDTRRAELKRIRDAHDAVLSKAAKDDFQAKIDHARAKADDRLYGRIRGILDKEDQRNERQKELDEGERAIEQEAERRRLDEREAYRIFAYNEARRKQRAREDKIKQNMEDEEQKVAEHMAELNFQKELTKTERQLVAEDRRYKAEQKAKRDAHYRFKLQQKIDRETAKAEHIAFLRQQMRDDAVRTNVLEAERRRLECEAARKELHHTYADAATPKSFTRGTRVYGKIGLGETGDEVKYSAMSSAGRSSGGRRSRRQQSASLSRASPSQSEKSRGVSASPSVRSERAVNDSFDDSFDEPKRSFKYGERNGMGDEPEPSAPRAPALPGGEDRMRSPTFHPGDDAAENENEPETNTETITEDPAPDAPSETFAPENTAPAGNTDGYDDENEDPKQEQ